MTGSLFRVASVSRVGRDKLEGIDSDWLLYLWDGGQNHFWRLIQMLDDWLVTSGWWNFTFWACLSHSHLHPPGQLPANCFPEVKHHPNSFDTVGFRNKCILVQVMLYCPLQWSHSFRVCKSSAFDLDLPIIALVKGSMRRRTQSIPWWRHGLRQSSDPTPRFTKSQGRRRRVKVGRTESVWWQHVATESYHGNRKSHHLRNHRRRCRFQ